MKIITLRYGDNFAPKCGTIKAHSDMIEKNGFVWFGKFGNAISPKIIEDWMQEEEQRLLLIKSGTNERYWCYVTKHQREIPPKILIPAYYRNKCDNVKCWFRIKKIEKAQNDVVSKCFLVSTGGPLTTASKVSMNPCMFVNYKGR